jgi:hypothetical protein
MQIKTTLRFQLTPVRMAIIKNRNDNKCWQGCGKKEPSYTAGGNVNNSLEASQNSNNRTAIQSSNSSPRDIPKGMEVGLQQRHLHTHVYGSTIPKSSATETVKILHY